MANPSKRKGTAAETAAVKAARRLGFPLADRHPLKGAKDEGDIWLCPGLIVEVKARKTRPSAGQIEDWLDETLAETHNAHADFGFLLFRQPGIPESRAECWPAYFKWNWLMRQTSSLIADLPLAHEWATVSMEYGALLKILRRMGWGTEIWGEPLS